MQELQICKKHMENMDKKEQRKPKETNEFP